MFMGDVTILFGLDFGLCWNLESCYYWEMHNLYDPCLIVLYINATVLLTRFIVGSSVCVCLYTHVCVISFSISI